MQKGSVNLSEEFFGVGLAYMHMLLVVVYRYSSLPGIFLHDNPLLSPFVKVESEGFPTSGNDYRVIEGSCNATLGTEGPMVRLAYQHPYFQAASSFALTCSFMRSYT